MIGNSALRVLYYRLNNNGTLEWLSVSILLLGSVGLGQWCTMVGWVGLGVNLSGLGGG